MDTYLKRVSSDTPKPSKIRKYDTNYIELGFIESSEGKPMCVICLQLLANEGMKPTQLKRHLLTKHPEYSNKPKEYSCGCSRVCLGNFVGKWMRATTHCFITLK